jgi:2-polyprenyl-3-methyl-5-hydroxy-6-metoxy-1,4-benzoquinol methylase
MQSEEPHISTEVDLSAHKQAEADFFDQTAEVRTLFDNIPAEADIRRATRSIPRIAGQPHFDPKMDHILEGGYRDRFIARVAHRPRGRVLDVCCGPGWLALELARHGQTVDAYDISPQAIALAKRMLSENPYRDGFGEINYYLQDVTKADLGYEKYDAVSGWAAFHHIPDLSDFMERVWRALKPGGIIATMDDMPQGFIDKFLSWSVCVILPNYYMSYPQKIKKIVGVLLGTAKLSPEVFSPMEQGKGNTVYDIADIFRGENYELLENLSYNSFAGQMMSVRGPDILRYPVARALVMVDRSLCRLGICKGFVRIMISRKR